MKMKLLFNPFERVAGWQALVIGVVVMALTAVVGHFNHVSFIGSLYVHIKATFSLSMFFAMQAVDFTALFLTMWLAGVCFSKTRLRAIDVAGTMALARVPMLALVIICFLPITPASPYEITHLVVFTLICIPFIIWTIALMYNAYAVSCHLKGVRAIVSFIGALIVAEIASKLIFIFLLSGLFFNSPTSTGICSVENPAVVADSFTIRQKTETVVKAFEQNDFESITVCFDDNMKKSLPAGVLKMTWMQLNMAYGKFEKADMDNLKEAQTDKYDMVEVPFHFQKEKLKLRLIFNKDGTIGGLFIQPIN